MESNKQNANSKKRGPPWFCKKCPLHFKNVRLLYAHRKAVHVQFPKEHLSSYIYNEQNKTFTCKVCSLELNTKNLIDQHVLLHEEKFTCEECDAIVYSPYKYSLHLRKHNPKEGYKCTLCDYKTIRQSGIFLHISRVHLKRFGYMCKHCGKGFDDIITYNEHESRHISSEKISCIVCKKEFPYTRYLIHHQLRNHRVTTIDPKLEYQCGVCKKSFTTDRILKEHKKIHNKTNDSHQHLCEWCGKSFKEKTSYTNHVMSHADNKQHKCSYCDKAFTKKAYLTLHERIHSGERPYVCSQCEKAFNQPTALKRHIRCHTGERPYACDTCGLRFTSKTALNKHVITRCG